MTGTAGRIREWGLILAEAAGYVALDVASATWRALRRGWGWALGRSHTNHPLR